MVLESDDTEAISESDGKNLFVSGSCISVLASFSRGPPETDWNVSISSLTVSR